MSFFGPKDPVKAQLQALQRAEMMNKIKENPGISFSIVFIICLIIITFAMVIVVYSNSRKVPENLDSVKNDTSTAISTLDQINRLSQSLREDADSIKSQQRFQVTQLNTVAEHLETAQKDLDGVRYVVENRLVKEDQLEAISIGITKKLSEFETYLKRIIVKSPKSFKEAIEQEWIACGFEHLVGNFDKDHIYLFHPQMNVAYSLRPYPFTKDPEVDLMKTVMLIGRYMEGGDWYESKAYSSGKEQYQCLGRRYRSPDVKIMGRLDTSDWDPTSSLPKNIVDARVLGYKWTIPDPTLSSSSGGIARFEGVKTHYLMDAKGRRIIIFDTSKSMPGLKYPDYGNVSMNHAFKFAREVGFRDAVNTSSGELGIYINGGPGDNNVGNYYRGSMLPYTDFAYVSVSNPLDFEVLKINNV